VWAFELAHRGSEIADRLGVARLRFAPGPLPERAPPSRPPAPARPAVEHADEAARLAAGIEDEDLRETVEKAIAFSLGRPPSDRPV